MKWGTVCQIARFIFQFSLKLYIQISKYFHSTILGSVGRVCCKNRVLEFWPKFLSRLQKNLAKKFWPKNLTPNFFCSNRYPHCVRACFKFFFKIACVVSEKNGKQISTCDKALFASMHSYLQFEWNRKYLSSAIVGLRDRLLIAPWYGFHLLEKGL